MNQTSSLDTKPGSPGKQLPSNWPFFITLVIGILMGMVVMCLVGYGLYFFGYVELAGEAGSPPGVNATQVKVPVCPTCEVSIQEPLEIIATATPIPIETLTITATIDFGATATAACGAFNEQFPGTPCPSP